MHAIVCAGLLTTIWAADLGSVPSGTSTVEAVFVLDTTGSMGGLIQAAKDKIWSIANTLAKAEPTPKLKIGLVGYRDRGDAYVTKLVPLTEDLDAAYRELIAFQADGGGDEPESVNQALHEAVTKFPWSKTERTYRVVFLVGDCPPHMDYDEDVKYPETCRQAATAGIVINTVQCGSATNTEPVWREIAAKAEGRYFRVDQDGGALLAETPFDADLARLSVKLDETCLYYGKQELRESQLKRKATAFAFQRSASVTANAQRAVFNVAPAGKDNLVGQHELLDAVDQKKVDLNSIADEELPEELKPLSPAERAKFVNEKQAERQAIQREIADLAKKRQAHLEALARQSVEKPLEHLIFESIRDQGAKVGIRYADGPAF
jgi:Mg-chelatase subunit ChlD